MHEGNIRVALGKLTLVLGGAASGKSAFAEALTLHTRLRKTYWATATSEDAEMAVKIGIHQARRSDDWRTIESEIDWAPAFSGLGADDVVLMDCATLWLSNHLVSDLSFKGQADKLLAAIAETKAPVIIVSNEVGQGVVPAHSSGRRFRDAQGKLNQALAARADLVINMIAGLPQVLKGTMPEGLS